MKKILLLCAAIFTLGIFSACKNNNDSMKGGWSFKLPGTKATQTIKTSGSIKDTKWMIAESVDQKEAAYYVFINDDESVVIAHRARDEAYGYVVTANNDYIFINCTEYTWATGVRGSQEIVIDRENNFVYPGLLDYKSRDPRKRKPIFKVPMSDYKGLPYERKNDVLPIRAVPRNYE